MTRSASTTVPASAIGMFRAGKVNSTCSLKTCSASDNDGVSEAEPFAPEQKVGS